MTLLATLVSETEELAPLLMPPLAFAGVALAVFIVLAFVTWSFRDVANRHSDKIKPGADSHGAGH